ncbi:MAG: hypothetical protein L3I99_03155 [Sulfurimonas sp.]|nr:hypothetical protein [Sulfurimonas sp.]
MRYSYIKPHKKSIFTSEIKLVVIFFTMTIFMLFATYAFLLIKNSQFQQDKINIVNKKYNIDKNIKIMEVKIAYIEKQDVLSQKIFTKNSVLKDSIKNLFDLVPQRITLSKAKLLDNGLILHGITPNKDVYNFMLHAPLRSIFHRTYSSFYPAKDGWLNFVSTNYMDNEIEKIMSERIDDE